ncbi:non-motile and phage-resistance protein [bacterium MnTg02]|nr:non-motile and phage-resistance protein [bacterium MnTg02]
MRSRSFNQENKDSLIRGYSELLGDALLRHRTEIAERARRVEAEQADKIKSSFLANMSHELRTPLNAIIGFSKFLEEIDRHPVEKETIREYASYIHETAGHLLAIINDVLQISKLQSSAPVLDGQEVLVSEVLNACLTLVRVAADEAGVELLPRIRPDIPMVSGDPVKLKQVFSNILSNAVKFTPRGGTVHLKADLNNDGCLLISIRDTGSGMTADEIAIALTPFGQVQCDRNRGYEGTGLGLPIAKALVELHDGKLEIRSEKGVGTEISVTLPVAVTDRETTYDDVEQAIAVA